MLAYRAKRLAGAFLVLTLLAFICYSFQGFSYRCLKTQEPLSIHVLEIDPSFFSISPYHAKGQVLGRDTVLTMVRESGALAGINGGFFKGSPWEGLPAGVLKINNHWLGWPTRPRGAIGWNDKGTKVFFDRILCYAWIEIEGRPFTLQGINKPRGPSDLILFTSAFNRTTRTSKGVELIVRGDKVESINQQGNSTIPADGCVFSVGPKANTAFWSSIPKEAPAYAFVKILPQMDPRNKGEWESLPYIVGGVPLLIHQGAIIHDFSPEKSLESFLTQKHARTAVGLLPNGHWLFVVVDGRQPRLSVGMTMKELAALMFDLGCVEALNLDGGGSSTMVIQDRVVNDPVGDEDEGADKKMVRQVSDAILIFKK